MRQRIDFLTKQAGFSLVGTLIAVTVGSIVAILVATVLSRSIQRQRTIIDRDEASQFALYLTELLTSDATCTPLMQGKEFSATTPVQLKLAGVGYGNQTGADITSGFTFAANSLSVFELSYENTSPNPVSMRMSVESPAGSGSYVDRVVRRHLLRVKLILGRPSSESAQRPRFFEFPALVGEDNRIEACNNEINIGDACQSMGFKWSAASSPPVCVPDTSCMFGGSYTVSRTGVCRAKHKVTEECVCPVGYKSFSAGSINIEPDVRCTKGCDKITLSHDTVVQCYKCPL